MQDAGEDVCVGICIPSYLHTCIRVYIHALTAAAGIGGRLDEVDVRVNE